MGYDYKDFTTQETIDFSLYKKKNESLKKCWIAAGTAIIISIILIAAVTTYFVLRSKNPSENIQSTGIPETTTEKIQTTTVEIETTTTTPQTTIPYPIIPTYLATREIWGASPPKSSKIPTLNLPIKRIIIGHTGGEFCDEENRCKEIVRSIQSQDKNLDDIPYNFLIGGDGKVYEGRGFYFEGQHTENIDATEYNSIGICIAFIGSYQTRAPTDEQIKLLNEFIETFKTHELISNNYIMVLQDDLKYFPTKATALNNAIEELQNFRSLYKIYRREEWNADLPVEDPILFERTMNWILIGHTVTPLCTNLATCANRVRSIQEYSFLQDMNDIMYNFVFGGDGLVFEGRGWNNKGAHAVGLNDKTIGTGVIGDFASTPPNEKIINAMLQVFDDAMALGKLTEDYKIFGRSDFGGPGPGAAFMNIIRGFCRYGNRTTSCDQTEPTTIETTSPPSKTTQSPTTRTTSEPPLVPNYFTTRDSWGADPPRSMTIPSLNFPIKRIIIGHTGGDFCAEVTECKRIVKSIQTQDLSLDDIPYNFLIGGDGKIYEGRGFNFEGQHTSNKDATNYDSIGICIAFIGNYESTTPNSTQIDVLNDFIATSINQQWISSDHVIVSQDDLKYFTTKATSLNDALKNLPKYRSLYKIHRREEWNAQLPMTDSTLFGRTMEYVLIGHTVTPLCNDLSACISRVKSLQEYAFSVDIEDIMYNFIFGGDGLVFEGRGWDYIAAHAYGYNSRMIGFGTIGDFSSVPPNENIINALLQVLDDALVLGKLTEDYKVFGRSDFGGPGPGEPFMNIIKEWCRYGNRTNPC